ncbi:DinB family protein [Larkinella terrae]|uniref:DinB family protein n=1 Tax=Larkinella terrae TaxID=2025311 RepID=A0A7K0EFH1_9BACT|nr:DinB family protein [Larkinella terrae]MRS60206.1 DinB family protein [Larkinella terrae]
MNRQIIESVTAVLEQIADVLSVLKETHYTARLAVLSGVSLGEHVRHVVEFYQELEVGYQTGLVDYDARKREKELETGRDYAVLRLQQIVTGLQPENKVLQLTYKIRSSDITHLIKTNYERELLYNLEHAVHHMALLKIGIQVLTDIRLPDHFGIAGSTIQYRQAQCAP